MKALILEGDQVLTTDDYAVVTAAHAAGKTFWIELDERCERGTAFMADTLKIHPLAIEDVWNDVGLPKVDDFDDYIQIVVHGIREDDRASNDVPIELAEIDLVVGKSWLLTHAHDERACAVTPVQLEIQRSARLLRKGPAWVAHAIMDRMVDQYLPLIDRFDEQIEAIETQILAGTAKSDRQVIPRIIRIKLVPFYRDVYDHFARVTELVDSYRELVTSLLEAQFSMQSNRMNEIMKRLTILSTIMLPLSLIAGIYGMNFKHMPELEWFYGYPTALGLMALVAVSILVFFRTKRWI
jgi:magnesium transporter